MTPKVFSFWGHFISKKHAFTDNVIKYYYDENEQVTGLNYLNNDYYFIKNLQGDILKIVDSNNIVHANYFYDAWGRVVKITNGTGNDTTTSDGLSSTNIGNVNPFRYRGYYYDVETNLYYTTTRFYDPETGRFINADKPGVLLACGGNLQDHNLFIYCNNDPVNRADPSGKSFGIIIFGILFAPLDGRISWTITKPVGSLRNKNATAISGLIFDQKNLSVASSKYGLVTLGKQVAN